MKVRISGDNFKRIMSICPKVMEKNSFRELLTKVCIRVYGTADTTANFEAIGMDPWHMAICYGPCTIEGDEFADPYEILLPVMKVPKCNAVEIVDDGNQISVSFIGPEPYEQKVAKTKGEYIDVDKILAKSKQTSTMSVSVNPKMLAQLLQALGSDERMVTLRLYDDINGIVIEGENNRGFILPMRNTEMKTQEEAWKKRQDAHR